MEADFSLCHVEFGHGYEYAACECGKVFHASGSRGVCEFIRAQIKKHVDTCRKDSDAKD